MATALKVHKPAAKVDALIRMLRSLATRDGARKYVNLRRVARLLDTTPAKMAPVVADAVDDGLIDGRDNADGSTSIVLTDFAATMIGVGLKAAPTLAIVEDEVQVPELVLIVARTAGTSPLVQELADANDLDVETLWDSLQDLRELGWVHSWEDNPAGPSVCLTPFAAGRVNLRMADDGSRWLAPNDFDPTDGTRRIGNADAGDDDAASIFNVTADPNAPEPIDEVIAIEALESVARRLESLPIDLDTSPAPSATKPVSAKERRRIEAHERATGVGYFECIDPADEGTRIPRPNVIRGSGPTWPIMTLDHAGNRVPWRPGLRCMCCHGVELKHREVCINCCRSGVDHLLALLPKSIGPDVKPTVVADEPRVIPIRRATALRGGCG